MITLPRTIFIVIGLSLVAGCSAKQEAAKSKDLTTGDSIATQVSEVRAEVAAMHADIDQPAPQFTLPDASGQPHALADYHGKYVVLEWINFGCPFVKAQYESGNMQNLQKTYTDQGVIWLTICSSAPDKQGHFEGDELRRQIKEHRSNATAYLVDSTGDVGRRYEAKTTPNMYIIDPSGTLIYAGAIDDTPTTDASTVMKSKNYVRLALDAAMKGEPVPVKTSQPYGCSVKY